jgi:hypothetical protein
MKNEFLFKEASVPTSMVLKYSGDMHHRQRLRSVK